MPHANRRKDLAAEMFREMLCVLDLCDYGTSPRVCFPISEFQTIMPNLIERWKDFYLIQWGEPYVWDINDEAIRPRFAKV